MTDKLSKLYRKKPGNNGDRKGQQNPHSVLTEDDVVAIRLNTRGLTPRGWAKVFAVSERTIRKIINHERWAHVEISEEVEARVRKSFGKTGRDQGWLHPEERLRRISQRIGKQILSDRTKHSDDQEKNNLGAR